MGCGAIVDEWIAYEQPELKCGDHDPHDGSLVECVRCICDERDSLHWTLQYLLLYFNLPRLYARRHTHLPQAEIDANVAACVEGSVVTPGWVRSHFVPWI